MKKLGAFIVPTGVGASIGGFAGDASSCARKFAKKSKLIVNPNVVNTINEKLGLKEEGGKITSGIATYLDGVTYYIARIKHFNELTPWTAGEGYGTKNDKYLGRYGVLRNNWYDLSVTSISGLGYPDIPEVKPTVPDDENEQYINVEVKILSWAKRSQQIKL